MDPADNNEQTRPESVPEAYGQRLAAAREARNFSVAEMAARLCQTGTRVTQMETGAWDQLGPPVYGRGYVAAYARELGMDPRETVAYFEELERRRLDREQEVAATRPRPARPRHYQVLFACVAATALIAVPVAWWLIHAFQGASGNAVDGVVKQPAVSSPEREPSTGGQPLMASIAALPEIERPPRTAPESLLVLRFSEEVWIDARDGRGARIAYGLMAAGSERRLPVADGLSVRLGNADGVSAELGGSPYDLEPFTREDTVEIVIPSAPAQ